MSRRGIRHRLGDWWDSLFDGPDPEGEATPVEEHSAQGQWLIGAIAASMGVGVLVLLGVLLRSTAGGEEARPRHAARTVAHSEVDPRSARAQVWLAQADAAASKGAFDDAVRLAYLAVLAHQDTAGNIDAEPGKANGEYVRTFRGSSTDGASFARATLMFDQARYGSLPPDGEAWRAVRNECVGIAGGAP